ncbi:SAM-dependent methyltransferase [Treponema sp.]|uniref:SAM-dependent methyltransferase n=1 Tax=Treponema sp. TaxID=166 RepID=UPI0025D1E2C0|nr:SAM-dependent methyltransferase [Treponema sp.]MBR4322328.1 SAM-dependent methyltransferase [Treponema sp.]
MESALYLIPCPMGETAKEQVLPSYNTQIVKNIRHFIVESRKAAVRFLVSLDKTFPIDDCTFTELSEHTDQKADLSKLLLPLEKGESMGVISDAGCPCIGDPGSRAVEIAQKKNLRIIPLVGPNSMIMAIMASGFNGQNFAFNGYLPVKSGEREGKIKQLENKVYKEDQTQLFIETPYRNQKMLEAILKTCRPETKLCLASGITTSEEFIKTKTIAAWKKEKIELKKIPMIFLMYK